MERRYAYSRNVKPIAVTTIAFALAALFYKFDGEVAQGCELLNRAAGIALEIVLPVLRIGWHGVPACLSENATFLQPLSQIAASIWLLLCVVAG
jgi:hypothetical protein